MKKHPSNFKVLGRLVALVESVQEDPVILYEGMGGGGGIVKLR